MIYAFGDCELDTGLYSLQRAGQTIRLRPKAFRVCLYLLEHRDRVVSRDELCAQVWRGQFISQATLEGVIRVVRQAVGDSGQAQSVIQTLHGYGYRFVASVAERPSKGTGREAPLAASRFGLSEAAAVGQSKAVSAAVAEAPEPEAIADLTEAAEASRGGTAAKEHGAAASAVIGMGDRRTQPSESVRKVIRGVLALVILTVVMLAGWMLWRGVRAKEMVPLDKSRIAVLPFVNLSAEAEHTYFADGMTEALLAQLSQIRGLTVIARTSVMQYKGSLKDIATIGRELQVGTILEGSVRTVEDRVRVSTQLVDVASQAYLWSQEYDRELKEVFAIQNDIATRVAEHLKVKLRAGEQQGLEEQRTEILEAYTL
jgi:TolB-like protein/DNA-binding winged helix-turn-helix (wHTH) protein